MASGTMRAVETFLVRLWASGELAADDGERWPQPSSLRGVVESPGRHGSRPFVGGEQLLSQLEAALAARLRERAEDLGAQPARGGDDEHDDAIEPPAL